MSHSPDRGSGRRARRPGRARRWVVRPAVWLLVAGLLAATALLLFLESPYARSRAADLATARLSEALGRSVTLERVDFDLVPLGFAVEGLVIPDADPAAPPLASVERLEATVSVTGLLEPTFTFEQVVVTTPRIRLVLHADGSTNLPELSRGEGGGRRLEVAIGHLLVERGVLELDERRLPLELEARGVTGRLAGIAARGGTDAYRLRADVRRVEARLGDAEPYPVALSAEAMLRAGQLELVSGSMRGEGLEAELTGALEWGEVHRAVTLDVEASGEAALANRLGFLDQPVRGPLRFAGTLGWEPERWSVEGTVRSPGLETLERRLDAVVAHLEVDPSAVGVELVEAEHAGGELSGDLRVALAPTAAGDSRAVEVHLSLRELALGRLLADQGLPAGLVAGRVSGELHYAFDTAAPLAGSGVGRLAVSRIERPGERLALSGEARLGVDGGRLVLEAARLEGAGQALTAGGSFDLLRRTGTLRYRVVSGDLAELAFLLPEGALRARLLPVGGGGELEGRAVLGAAGVSTEARFTLDEPSAAGMSASRVSGGFTYLPGRLEALEVTAWQAGGELVVRGDLGLPGELDLEVELLAWPTATLAAFLPEGLDPVGDLDGSLTVTGRPEALAVRGELSAAPLVVAGVESERVRGRVDLVDGVLRLSPVEVTLPAGQVFLRGTVGLAGQGIDLDLGAAALDLAREPFRERIAGDLGGTVAVEATLSGSLAEPVATVALEGRELSLEGRRLGEGGEATLTGRLEQGRLEARGSLLGLVAFDGGGRLDAGSVDLAFELDSDRLPEVVRLVSEASLPPFEGAFAGTLAVTGRPDEAASLEARLELSRLTLAYEEREIANLQPVVVELDREAVNIRSLFLGEAASGSELFLGGRIGLGEGEQIPLRLQLETTLNAAWAELLLPDVSLDGTFRALATIRGTLADPAINGQGEMIDGQVLLPGFPHALEAVTATVLFYPDQVVLDSLTTQLAGGRVRAAGQLDLPEPGEAPSYRLQTQAEGLTVRYPEGWVVRGGGEVNLVAPVDGGRELRGVVRLERAFYLQDVPLSFAQLLQRAFRRERLTVGEADEMKASTHLSLAVQGEEALRVRNNLADLRGDIDLTLRGTLANPVIFGQVELAPGGTLVFRDTEYRVRRGLLTFPYSVEPVIDLVADAEVRDYDVQLSLSGTLERLNASFSSDPPLADLEVLSLLATGSTTPTGQTGAGGSALAETFLFGQAASAISERVGTLFGFDKFRIQPNRESGGESLGAVNVVVEKRLSRDLTVSYTANGANPENDLLQIAWDIYENVTLVLTREGDDTYAVDARLEHSF